MMNIFPGNFTNYNCSIIVTNTSKRKFYPLQKNQFISFSPLLKMNRTNGHSPFSRYNNQSEKIGIIPFEIIKFSHD